MAALNHPNICIIYEVDFRTDIWALGAIFYEMLTGASPFQNDHEQALIFSILNEQPMATGLKDSCIY